MQPALDHFGLECQTRPWSAEYIACITAATDSFTAGMGCRRLGPPELPRPISPQTKDHEIYTVENLPITPYMGSDSSCASVGKHVGLASQPDPASLTNLSPEDRQRKLESIAVARATIPDQVEAACDQGAWTESVRRCMLAAVTSDAIGKCM